ncbi:MAG: YbaN family protein, partial [Thermoplasmata archaeon]
LWNVAGTFFLSLGLIGIAVPLLPTTPFLLLAAACYLRGSRRMYDWMLTNRYFGTYLRDYMERKGMPRRVKMGTIALLWCVIGFSALALIDSTIVRLVLLAVAIGVTVHILAIKTKKEIPDRR